MRDLGSLSAPKTSRDTGLFSALMGGNPGALIEDAVISPDKYDEETRALLEGIAAGRVQLGKLTSREVNLLNGAVVDYAGPDPTKAQPNMYKKATSPEGKSPEETELTPEDELPDYWWG